jgi:group I intron endonuclease
MIITNLEELPKNPGIYKLRNTINNKIYIGKGNNLKYRIAMYFNKNENKSRPIINAIQKYGFNNFEIEILHWYDEKMVDINMLLALETAFILEYDCLIKNGNGYNVCLVGNDSTGRKLSPETRMKMSKNSARKNKPILENTRIALILSNKNRIWKESTKIDRSIKSMGHNNPKFDHTIYKFLNLKTNEIFEGFAYDFRKKYNFPHNCIYIMKRGKYKNWTIVKN